MTTIKASTPEEMRDEFVAWLRQRALTTKSTSNTAAADFWASVIIEPKLNEKPFRGTIKNHGPVVIGERLYGQVYGHPNFSEGDHISTSTVVSRNGDYIETKNSRYRLG